MECDPRTEMGRTLKNLLTSVVNLPRITGSRPREKNNTNKKIPMKDKELKEHNSTERTRAG